MKFLDKKTLIKVLQDTTTINIIGKIAGLICYICLILSLLNTNTFSSNAFMGLTYIFFVAYIIFIYIPSGLLDEDIPDNIFKIFILTIFIIIMCSLCFCIGD